MEQNESAYKGYEKELLNNEFDHVRLIHFSLLAVASTLLYLVLANWSGAPELARELADVRITADAIRQGDTRKVAQQLPNLANRCRQMWTNALQEATSPALRLSFDPPAHQLLTVTPQQQWADPTTVHLDALRDIMQERRGYLRCIESLGGDGKFKEWVRNNKGEKPRLTSFTVEKWPADSEGQGQAHAQFEMTTYETRRGMISDGLGRAWGEVIEEKQISGDFVFSIKVKKLDLGEQFFDEQFPRVGSYWSSLHDLTLGAAQEWALQHRAELLSKKSINVVGLEVEGRHLGIIGPVILLCLLLYLLAYVKEMARFIEGHPVPSSILPFSAPWVGAIPNSVAGSISLLTLVLLVAASTFLPLWRPVTGLHGVLAAVLTVPLAGLGFLVFRQGRRIAEALVLSPTIPNTPSSPPLSVEEHHGRDPVTRADHIETTQTAPPTKPESATQERKKSAAKRRRRR